MARVFPSPPGAVDLEFLLLVAALGRPRGLLREGLVVAFGQRHGAGAPPAAAVGRPAPTRPCVAAVLDLDPPPPGRVRIKVEADEVEGADLRLVPVVLVRCRRS